MYLQPNGDGILSLRKGQQHKRQRKETTETEKNRRFGWRYRESWQEGESEEATERDVNEETQKNTKRQITKMRYR